MQFDEAYFGQLAETIDAAEQKTSAEIVVAVVSRSGSYRDVDLLTGACLAFLGLLFIVYNPWTVHSPVYFPVEVGLLFGVGFFGSRTIPGWRRLLTTEGRRQSQVLTAAREQFLESGVGDTRARTGLLVFLALEERHAVVLPDVGVTRAVDPPVWNALAFQLAEISTAESPAERLLQEIAELGPALEQYLPATEDDSDEIPNQPHVEVQHA